MFHQTGASKDIKEEEGATPLGDSTKNWQTFVESGSSYDVQIDVAIEINTLLKKDMFQLFLCDSA